MRNENMDAEKAAQTLWDAAVKGAESEHDLIAAMNWIDQILDYNIDVFEKLLSSGLHDLMEEGLVEELCRDLKTMNATWSKNWWPAMEKMYRARQTS